MDVEWTRELVPKVNGHYMCGSSSSNRSSTPVMEAFTMIYVPGDADEYEGWEIPDEAAFFRYVENTKSTIWRLTYLKISSL